MRNINILKQTILTALIASCFIASNSYAETNNGMSGNEIVGDEYWKGARLELDKNGNPKKTKFDLSNISASKIKNTLEQKENDKVSQIRYDMIRTAAYDFGLQAGMAAQANKANAMLDEYNTNKKLEKYNFGILQIEPGLLPPVISEANNVYHKSDDNTVRIAKKLWKIEEPAKIVSSVPNWRSYLYLDVAPPSNINPAVLPKNSAENEVWDKWVKAGWEKGVEQIEKMAFDNMARLERDYKGMLKYKELYDKGLAIKPKLQRKRLGVTGGGNEMSVGDEVIRKVREAQLNPNQKDWYGK